MPAYQPGRGLNGEALERLRARKQQGPGVLDLPAQDESKQWDRLLGNGAKKKPRCGICTRPLDEESQAAESLVCLSCHTSRPEQVNDRAELEKSLSGSATPLGSSTASTVAVSEDLDVRVEENNKMSLKVNMSKAPRAGPSLSTPAQMLESLKQVLNGDWVNEQGETYRMRFHGGTWWTCVLQDASHSQSFSISFDSGRNTVWWGTGRDYFCNVHDILERPVQLTWYPGSKHLKEHPFVWYRPDSMPDPGWDQRESFETKESARASAINDIEDQLGSPGSNGHVWIPKWNKWYKKDLGTLRQFLESCPDKFRVIPGEGKTFTVELVSCSTGNWKFSSIVEEKRNNDGGVANSAIEEIEKQLREPGKEAIVRVPNWHERYLPQLGHLREFIESRPDKFTVLPGKGNRYRVVLAGGGGDQQWRWW